MKIIGKIFVYGVCLLALPFFFACSKKKLEPEEYIHWVESRDNELKKVKEVGDYVYELQYWPIEYKLLKESETRRLGEKYIAKKKEENGSFMYFKLRMYEKSKQKDILEYGVSGMNDYYKRIDYLSYGFEENIACFRGKDTLLPCVYHFERTYSVSPFADVMFTFKDKSPEDFTVLVDDIVFNGGPLKFEFKKSSLSDLPELKTF